MNAAIKYDILEFDNDMDDFIQQDNEEMELEIKTICELTLNELMGVDHDVWIKRSKKFGFDMEIDNDEDKILYKEAGIHPYAIDSLATFCRRFLNRYSDLMDREIS